jgi:heme oxygenase
MSILREYTNAKHREAEARPFVQYMLNGNIKKEHYALFLQQMYIVYSNIEYFAEMSHLLTDLPDIKRASYIEQDLQELNYSISNKPLLSTEKYRQRIVDLYYGNKKELILAHIYVRHMGDLYGGKIISKRVPGSGKAYQFEDRPKLIKNLDAKLSLDIVEESLLAFDYSMAIFDELMENINE